LDEVRDFDCGCEEWCAAINEWIKGGDAIRSMKKRNTKVWLYYDLEHGFVGYGSLGTSNWKALFPADPKKRILLLPSLGVQENYQGKGYGKLICGHLIQEAQDYFQQEKARGVSIAPFLGLLVHPRNLNAKRLYKSVGFSGFEYFYVDPDDGIRYEGMGKFLTLKRSDP